MAMMMDEYFFTFGGVEDNANLDTSNVYFYDLTSGLTSGSWNWASGMPQGNACPSAGSWYDYATNEFYFVVVGGYLHTTSPPQQNFCDTFRTSDALWAPCAERYPLTTVGLSPMTFGNDRLRFFGGQLVPEKVFE